MDELCPALFARLMSLDPPASCNPTWKRVDHVAGSIAASDQRRTLRGRVCSFRFRITPGRVNLCDPDRKFPSVIEWRKRRRRNDVRELSQRNVCGGALPLSIWALGFRLLLLLMGRSLSSAVTIYGAIALFFSLGRGGFVLLYMRMRKGLCARTPKSGGIGGGVLFRLDSGRVNRSGRGRGSLGLNQQRKGKKKRGDGRGCLSGRVKRLPITIKLAWSSFSPSIFVTAGRGR